MEEPKPPTPEEMQKIADNMSAALLTGIPEILNVLEEMQASKPRTAAILACALLDNSLKAALIRRFVESETAHKKLFKDGAARETFGKIELGFAIGIFDKEIRENLEGICAIRNKFAHILAVADFDHPDLDEVMKKITLWQRFQKAHPLISLISAQHKPDFTKKRDRFTYSFITLYEFFLMDAFRPPPKPKPAYIIKS